MLLDPPSFAMSDEIRALRRSRSPRARAAPSIGAVPPVRTIVVDRAPEPVLPPAQRDAVRAAPHPVRSGCASRT